MADVPKAVYISSKGGGGGLRMVLDRVPVHLKEAVGFNQIVAQQANWCVYEYSLECNSIL